MRTGNFNTLDRNNHVVQSQNSNYKIKDLNACIRLTLVLFLACLSIKVNAQNITLSSYTGQSEITASSSITLTNGFQATGNVHIYISPYSNCVAFHSTPSQDQNYIATRQFKIPGVLNDADVIATGRTTCEVNQAIQYFDGLGRPVQEVNVQGSPAGKDVIQPFAYDAFGRETTKYLSYAATSNGGAYRTDALQTGLGLKAFYATPPAGVTSTASPYATTVMEQSPLNRPVEQGAPGAAWQPNASRTATAGRTVVMDYSSNVTNEVRQWTVTSTGATSTTYAAHTLYKTITKDENWTSGKIGTAEEYKDFQGRIVLKRVWELEDRSLSTYYVYDDLGNLRYVLPPAVNENGQSTLSSFTEGDLAFNQFIYGYHYDNRNRLTEKKIPGKGWAYTVYNKLDQVVATQDAVQRAKAPQEWAIIKYDASGRVILTGIYTYPSSTANTSYRAALQTTLNSQSANWENRIITGNGYSNLSWPTSGITTTLTLNYFDDYNIPGLPAASPYNLAADYSAKTRTLATANLINVLGSSPAVMLWNVSYYDDKGRVVRVIQQHYKDGTLSNGNYDDVINEYSFADELLNSTRRHYVSAAEKLYVHNRNIYDHQGRLTDTYQKTGDNVSTTNPEVLLTRQGYNETGQLYTKKLHSTDDGTSFAQTITYSYNERGWLKGQSAALFNQALIYNESATGATPQFNGNISRQTWGAGKYYNYTYDKLNRLTSAVSDDNYNEKSIVYDVMGNIRGLRRYTTGNTLADQLRYDYSGNRLTLVRDTSTYNAALLQPANNTSYAYDLNGNIVSRTSSDNADNNLSSITYNYLNLPQSLIQNTNTITYTYDAAGNKLKKVVSGSVSLNNEYISGIQYEGGVLKYVATAAGRVVRNSATSYSYEYALTDHLGNNRVFFDIVSGAAHKIQETDYYAFGLDIQRSVAGTENKYQYNGKEKQDQERTYDYGARFYDPVIGRFTTADPMAASREALSPYNYVQNNPIMRIDPTGAYDWVYDKDKNVRWDENVTSADDKDLKTGDTYIGKTGEYTTKGGYTVELHDKHQVAKGDRAWNYAMPETNNQDPAGPTLQEAVAANMPLLKTGEGIAVGTAIIASGEIGGVEAAGNFLIGQAARQSEFLGGLANQGTNLVYQGLDAAGIVRYVGITERTADVRFAEHLGATGTGRELLDYSVIKGATGLSRDAARVIEQNLINQHGLGNLLNKINSIAPKNWVRFGVEP